MTTEEFTSYAAEYSGTVRKDTLQEKIDKLNERTAEKVDRLNPSKAVIENYSDTDYTGTQSKHGKNVNTTGVHDFTNQQEEFGRLVSEEQVYTGKFLNDGTSLNLDPNSNYKIKDGQYVKFDGPTRNAYMKNMGIDPVTGEQIQKFGLARNDLTDEAIAQGITPERARYMNKMGVKVYKGSGGDYDGTPGERGKAAGEAIFDATFDEKAITEFELNRYMDKSTIAARAMGLGKDTDYAAFGAGGSEYTIDRLDPLFNANAPKFEGSLPAGTQTPTVPKGFDKMGNPTGSNADRRDALNKLIKEQKANGGGLINAAKAFAYTLGEGVVNTLDLVPELAQFAYGNIVGDKKWSDSKGLYDTKESEAFKTWVEYNDEVVNAVGKETVTAAKNAWEKGDYWELLGAMGKAAVTPELLATSLGYVAGMVLPGGLATKALQMTSKVGKTANAIKAADATGKMTKGEALLQAEEAAGDGYKILKTMTDNVGFASEAEQFGRDAEKLYMDTYKTEMPTDQKMLVRPLGLLYAKLDALTAKAILMGKDPIAKAIPDMVNILPEAIQATVAGKIATMAGTTAAKAAGAFGLEGSTEAIQTAMEKVAGEYRSGKNSVGDVLEKEKYEIAGAGLMGGVGGNQMQFAGQIPGAIISTPGAIKKGIELATETPEQRITRQNVEFSTPLKNEAVVAALSGNAAEVVDRAEKVHGKLSKEIDASAPKSHTYGKILKDALDTATKHGDETAIDNVYKTIAALDKDETVEFNAKDMVNESAYAKTQELIKLINEDTQDADGKIAELKGEVGAEINKENARKSVKNAEIQALQNQVITEKRKYRLIMGTDEMDPMLEPLTKVEDTAKEYLAGTKTLDDVNKEFAELGFMDTEGKADPSRPGLATYEKELTDQLLNTETNKNLLKVGKGTSVVKLTGLTRFAQSRLDKLNARGTKEAYQTPAMILSVKVENERMLSTINNVLKVAKGLKNVDEATRKSYEAELTTADNAAIASSKELDRRNDILKTAVKPEGVAGALAFQVDTDGESIQAVTYKDGKPIKVKVANVVGEKAVPIDVTTTNTKVNSDSKTQKVVEEPTKEKIAEVLSKFDKLIKIELQSDGDWDYSAMTHNAEDLGLLKGAQIVYKYSKGNEKKEAVGTIVGAGKGAKVKIAVGKNQLELEINVWDINKLKKAPIEKYTETKVEVVESVVEVKESVEAGVEPTKVEVTKEVDLSNLPKEDRTFIKNYKSGRAKLTVARTEKYHRLMELAKQPKVKKESRGRKIKAAFETRINEDTDVSIARGKAMFKPEDEVKAYAETLSDEDIAEQTMAMEENKKAQEKLDEEAKRVQEQLDKEAFQKFSDSVDEIANRPEDTEETAPVEPEGPLAIINTEKTPSERADPLYTARQLIAKLSKDLSEAMVEVEDMNLKTAVRNYYKTELAKLEDKSTKIGDILWKLGEEISDRKSQNKIDKEMLNEYTKMKGVDKLIADLKVLVDSVVQILSELFAKLEKAKAERAEINTQKKKLAKDIKAILDIIEEIEAEYEAKYGAPTKNELKKSVGLITEYVDGLYGPMLDFNGNKTPIVVPDNGKYSTALNKALQKIREEKLSELKTELVNMDKGKTSLGTKLLGRLLTNFPLNSPIHKILKRGEDSVFGQLTGNMFADPARLLDVLPKGFKEFFAKDPESEEALLTNFKTMAEYIKNTEIGDILIGKSTKINYKTSTESNIDYNGLIMKNITEYVPTKLEDLKVGDRISIENGTVKQASGSITKIVKRKATKGPNVGEYGYTKYKIKNIEDGIITATKEIAIKGSIPWTHTIKINQNNSSNEIGVLTKTDNTAAVDVIELLGTVVDGKLQLDEQTQNILKFYSAKMLVDTQKMVGLILSLDESEMGEVLGIYDAEEQLKVKQDAMEGYINSASIRKDIGDEVYQALGLKFNELAPEFTVESFKSAIGILVQAIAIENGSIERKKGEAGGKNQNLIKTNWDTLTVERDALTKAIAKLQYLNENRNRPLPELKKPDDDNNRKVMNTQNPMDEKTTEFLNKQEKIAYKISSTLVKWLSFDEKKVLKARKYIDLSTPEAILESGLHISEVGAQMARNDKLVREWEILKTFAKATWDKKFYLKWGQTVSGRTTLLNDLNYEESKLHREFVVAEGKTQIVDVKDKDARQMLEASVLQGLDMDPDKLSPETASTKFNKLFKVINEGENRGITVEPVIDPETWELHKTQVAIKTAYEAWKKGELDAEAMAEVFADSEGHHGISSIELLVAWDEAIKSGKKLETHANLEIDAITSGMMIMLLQIGSDMAIAMAEKGGIYLRHRKEDLSKYVEHWLPGVTFTPGALIEAGKAHAAAIEAGSTATPEQLAKLKGQSKDLTSDEVFKDLYSTIGVGMIEVVKEYEKTLKAIKKPNKSQLQQLVMLEQIGELNLKNIRSIAKSPVMVYIYGATIGSIKKKLTYSLGVDTMVKAIKKASKLFKEVDKLVKDGKDASKIREKAIKELTFINAFLPEYEWKFVNEFGAKIEKPKELWKQLLALDITGIIDDIGRVINATFGTALETTFNTTLGFVSDYRNAIKSIEVLAFQAYQIRLADEVQKFLDVKYGAGRHKGESYKLSKDDMQNINQRLTEQGYGHNIVWYEDGETINQTLNKTDTKGGIHSSKVTVGKTSVGGQIKQFKPAVNTGAAPTISIHAIDGRMMMDALNAALANENEYNGGNIYDAIVLSINKAILENRSDSYNTNMIETGFKRSILADQLEMLEGMFYTKDEAGSRTFDSEIFNRVMKSIGLRPEGELRDDYTKEVNRLGFSTSKMLELIEKAEKVNADRVINSGKAYSSGHLYQMGSNVVDIDVAEARAKQTPVIEMIKKLLQDKVIADRKITHEEFAKAKVKINLHKDTDYVFNLDDTVNGKTQIESNANIAQIKIVDGKMNIDKKLWGTLGSNDTVQIIGSKVSREWLKSKDAEGDAKKWSDRILAEVLKSDAKIVANGFDKQLEDSGRQLVDGVWVKDNARPKSVVLKPADKKSKPEFDKLPKYRIGQKTMAYAGIGSRETPDDILALMTKAAKWLEAKGYKLRSGSAVGADKAFENGVKSNKEIFKGFDKTGPKEILIAHEIHPNLQGAMDYTAAKKVKLKLKEGVTKAEAEKAGERSAWAVQNFMARNTNQVFGAKLDTPVDFVLFYAEETKGIRPKGGTGQAVEMARLKGIPTINMADKDWRAQLTEVLKNSKKQDEEKVSTQSEDNNTPVKIVTASDGVFIEGPTVNNYILNSVDQAYSKLTKQIGNTVNSIVRVSGFEKANVSGIVEKIDFVKFSAPQDVKLHGLLDVLIKNIIEGSELIIKINEQKHVIKSVLSKEEWISKAVKLFDTHKRLDKAIEQLLVYAKANYGTDFNIKALYAENVKTGEERAQTLDVFIPSSNIKNKEKATQKQEESIIDPVIPEIC